MREIYLSKYQLLLLKIPFWYFGWHLWRDRSLAESVLQMPPQSDMSCEIATTYYFVQQESSKISFK